MAKPRASGGESEGASDVEPGSTTTQRLSRRIDRWADRGLLFPGVAAGSVLENTIIPLPLEVATIPIMIHRPRYAFRIAAALWLGIMIGSLIFYFIGAFAYETWARPLLWRIDAGALEDFLNAKLTASEMFWTIFMISLTPAPVQIATLGAGAKGANIFLFLSAIGTSRFVRYFGEAILAYIFGPRLAKFPKSVVLIGGTAIFFAYLYFEFG